MSQTETIDRLRIGLIGSGFIAGFHLQSMIGVRNATVAGVYSPTAANREAMAARATEMGLGPARAFDSLEAMIGSGAVDALWILTPNDRRVETMREIHRVATAG
ncbi:MAG: Gfo/Idh/MocA family oxidoreductase, partial [Minwuiales bacterium]|nr:Gfo/Idh/MocA family oxidoreductase [Minwuiales bacterium]